MKEAGEVSENEKIIGRWDYKFNLNLSFTFPSILWWLPIPVLQRFSHDNCISKTLFRFMLVGNETENNKSTVPLHSKVIKELLMPCRKLSETQSCNLVDLSDTVSFSFFLTVSFCHIFSFWGELFFPSDSHVSVGLLSSSPYIPIGLLEE